uniref:LO7 n=1 Tax=Bueycito anole adomavirus TaxID=2609873 RepID=A0A6F9F1W5_9VIRU|nr:TPA_asm: LO7 [Bueycito anole adomavirus]
MTTTGSENLDPILSEVLQENLTEQHIFAPITNQLSSREAQVGGGPDLTQVLNIGQPRETTLTLQVQKDEAIVQGSIRIVAEGQVHVVGGTTYKWKAKDAPNQPSTIETEIKLVAGTSSTVTSVRIPPYVMNSQFQTVDFRIGASGSLNSHLANVRGSTGGNGALAIVNKYYNLPEHPAYCGINSLDQFGSHQGWNRGIYVSNSDDTWQGTETLYHQLNCPNNCLSTCDNDDETSLKIFPRGMQIDIRFVTRPALDRARLQPVYKKDDGNVEQGQSLYLLFTTVKLIYSVCKIPYEYWPKEPVRSLFATMDIGIESFPVQTQQHTMTVHVTKAETDIIPQYIYIFAGPDGMWNTSQLRVQGYNATKDVIVGAQVIVNGSTTPDFMRSYVDSRIDTGNSEQRATMYNTYLGKGAFTSGRYRFLERPIGERHLLDGFLDGCAYNTLMVPTDVSSFLVREAASGVQVGRVDINIQLNATKVQQGMSLFVVKVSKQQIGFQKTSEFPGSLPQYEIDSQTTAPAYTHSVSTHQ